MYNSKLNIMQFVKNIIHYFLKVISKNNSKKYQNYFNSVFPNVQNKNNQFKNSNLMTKKSLNKIKIV